MSGSTAPRPATRGGTRRRNGRPDRMSELPTVPESHVLTACIWASDIGALLANQFGPDIVAICASTKASMSTRTPEAVSSSRNWGVRDGAERVARVPRTVALTNSSPSRKRAASISCTAVFRMIASEVAQPRRCGGCNGGTEASHGVLPSAPPSSLHIRDRNGA